MKFWFGKNEAKVEEPTPKETPTESAATSSLPPPTPQEPPAVEPPATLEEPPAPPVVQPAVASRPATASPNDRKALYYQMMNALYDAILVLDGNGHVVDCNERVEAVLGYTRDDLWDVSVTDVIPALKAQIFLQMKEGLRDQRRVLVNAHCRRKDGTSFQGEIGAGLMVLLRDSLVLSIRNIEKRTPPQAQRKPPVMLKTRPESSPKAKQG